MTHFNLLNDQSIEFQKNFIYKTTINVDVLINKFFEKIVKRFFPANFALTYFMVTNSIFPNICLP